MRTKLAYGLVVASAVGLSEAATLLQKRDGSHGHSHAAAPSSGYDTPDTGYGAPDTGYGAPDTGYGAPDTGYGAPDTGYGAPDTGYGAPATGYGAPDTGYGAPSYGGGGGKFNLDILGPLLWPIMAALLFVGLSLLFPTIISVDNSLGRKKRSLAQESNPVYDLAERVQDMYSAVLRSESCMEKIVCELGGMAKDLTASPVTGLVEPFVPTKYSNMYKTFKNGKDCHKIKC